MFVQKHPDASENVDLNMAVHRDISLPVYTLTSMVGAF